MKDNLHDEQAEKERIQAELAEELRVVEEKSMLASLKAEQEHKEKAIELHVSSISIICITIISTNN